MLVAYAASSLARLGSDFLRMKRRIAGDHRYFFAGLGGLPLMIAIVVPLYLSGTPELHMQQASPGATAPLTVAWLLGAPAQTPLTATRTVSPTAVPTLPSDPPQNAAVADVVDRLLAGQTGIYGIVITKPGTPALYRRNADLPFLTASLYKLVLLADIYAGIERGVLDPDLALTLHRDYFPGADEPVDGIYGEDAIGTSIPISEALFMTGAFSSNVASHALLSLTDNRSLEATARALGMRRTYFSVDPRELPDWPPVDLRSGDLAELRQAVAFVETQAAGGPLMLTTPRDITTFFDKLMTGLVINARVSGLILEILKQQAVADRFPCLLPLDTPMAHKTGNIDHVVHDAGVIWTPTGPVILVAMIEDAEDDQVAAWSIQQLALVAYHGTSDPAIAANATPDASCVA